MTQARTHPLEWAALLCCIVALSYTEWSLAVAAGAHPWVAAAVPGALDIYAIRAMRTRRHVPAVVCSMVAVNATSYLVHGGVLPMTWHVRIGVAAIVPLVFWAVHELGHGEHVPDLAERRKRVLWDVPQDAVLPDPESTHLLQHNAAGELVVSEHTDECDDTCTFDEHVETLPMDVPHMDTWDVPYDDRNVRLIQEYTPDLFSLIGDPEHAPERDTPATVLPLPDGFERETRTRRTLEQHTEEARALYGDRIPGVRELKRDTGGSTTRAQQVIEALKKGQDT